MARTRREKTLADYVVIAISPMLIMALVGSLAFFLLELSYGGQYEIRLKWILFCFVSASVLVARIAIEQGTAHASLFGYALVAVVGFAAMRLVDAFVIAWVLLAVSWWCTWKLTWDCTLIDENEDASGEGLLQSAGLGGAPRDEGENAARRVGSAHQPPGVEVNSADTPGGHSPPYPRDLPPTISDTTATSRRPHAPGLWVVYFSLAALPLFGAGQLLIPARDTAARRYGFGLLAVYVASALGLLLTTSFLGLRRNLRQRKLEMPVAMTGTWLGMGTALGIAILLLALLLPQPQGEYTLTTLVDKLDSKVRDASRFAVIHGDRGAGEGRRVGDQDQKADQPGNGPPPERKQDEQKLDDQKGEGKQNAQAEDKAKQGQRAERHGKGEAKDGQKGAREGDSKVKADQQKDGSQDEGKADGKGSGKGEGKGEGKGGKQKDDAGEKHNPDDQRKRGDQQQNVAEADGKKPPVPPPNHAAPAMTNFLTSLAPLFKWLVYGLLASVALYVVVRHWSVLVEALARLWAELLALFGFREEAASAGDSEGDVPPPIPLRPFASFEDPFFSGAARRMSPAQVTIYTFQALEAWAREQIRERPPDQTPLEFAEELGRRVPALAKDVSQTADLYARVAYARKSPSKDSLEVLERMWRRMQAAARV